MRPGQQNNNNNNKRMRGRGRKGPNPLSRSYESNGPDVKIRGTAQHIAERYATLARDATSAGDRVMAENYFQHSEHYGRIVAAAQGSFQPAQAERDYDSDEDENEDGVDDSGVPAQDGRNGQGRDRNDFQPRGEGSYRNEGQPRHDGQQRRDRDGGNREFRADRQDRNDGRNDRGEGNRENRENRENRDRNFRDRREQNGQPQAREGGEANGSERRDDDRAPRQERRFDNRDNRPRREDAAVVASDEMNAPVEVSSEVHADVGEPAARRRGRPVRQRLADREVEETVNAEVPSVSTQSPASVSADSEAASDAVAEAPRRRGRPPRTAAPDAAAVAEGAADAEPSAEAQPKRRPGRPRKVKPEGEAAEGEDKSELPAFLLASNG